MGRTVHLRWSLHRRWSHGPQVVAEGKPSNPGYRKELATSWRVGEEEVVEIRSLIQLGVV